MRFRELFRGSESAPQNLKYAALASVALHNILTEHQIIVQDEEPDKVVMLQELAVPENHAAASIVRETVMNLIL